MSEHENTAAMRETLEKIRKPKPCPFCGASVTISDVNPIGWPEKSYGVYCRTCGTHWETDDGKSKARAIAAWNRRVAKAEGKEESNGGK